MSCPDETPKQTSGEDGSGEPSYRRRLLYLGFTMATTLRMLARDRQPLHTWCTHLLASLGLFRARASRSIWIHGEGMGEFNAAAPLIAELRQRGPGVRFVFTTSRRCTIEWLARKFPDDCCLPHPWDMRPAITAIFRRLNPRLLVLLEYADGFCPGALLRARTAEVPVVVVNARMLPAGKPRRYHLADRLVPNAALLPSLFCTQDAETAAALGALGVAANRIIVTGNLKYDADGRLSLRERTPASPTLVAGCIHPEEEALVVAVFRRLRRTHPDLYLILAPQNPGQVDSIRRLLEAAEIGFQLRSAPSGHADAPVLLLDTFGELAAFYAPATVVLLGGSLVPGGLGHSLVEPALHGKPIVVGRHMESQRTMLARFLHADAVVQVQAAELVSALHRLLEDTGRCAELGRHARQVVDEERGATVRTLAALQPFLPGREVRDLPARPATWKRAVKALAATTPGQMLLATRARRLPALDELRDRLDRPDTILCLGNGPSSEDPRLTRIAHDCLFRVNWRWLERGRFAHPDVVFTGDRETVRRCRDCIFGFRTVAEELSVLMHTFCDRRPRIHCFTAERWPLIVNEAWPARPTNGAVMVAVAAALRPRRLVLAGIDLFRHPAGAYPDAEAANRYAPMHDTDVELAILRRVLDDYPGEVVVVSAILNEALGRRRAG